MLRLYGVSLKSMRTAIVCKTKPICYAMRNTNLMGFYLLLLYLVSLHLCVCVCTSKTIRNFFVSKQKERSKQLATVATMFMGIENEKNSLRRPGRTVYSVCVFIYIQMWNVCTAHTRIVYISSRITATSCAG